MQNLNKKYEFYIWVYFNWGIKNEDEIFLRTKSWRKILDGLEQKFDIFIGTKNIFNPIYN